MNTFLLALRSSEKKAESDQAIVKRGKLITISANMTFSAIIKI